MEKKVKALKRIFGDQIYVVKKVNGDYTITFPVEISRNISKTLKNLDLLHLMLTRHVIDGERYNEYIIMEKSGYYIHSWHTGNPKWLGSIDPIKFISDNKLKDAHKFETLKDAQDFVDKLPVEKTKMWGIYKYPNNTVGMGGNLKRKTTMKEQKIIKLTEKDLYTIVENLMNKKKKAVTEQVMDDEPNMDEMVYTNHANWARHIASVSGGDFKYEHDKHFQVATDSEGEYLGHWSHRELKGYIDKMDELPEKTQQDLGIVIDDMEYDYMDRLNESELLRESKGGTKKKGDTTLCARGKAAAKAKYDVYPSAYANGYAVQVCKGKIKGLDGKKQCSGKFC